ncbi:MAG TPA: GDSL-type esterase/lipase family protein [Terriglobales bacterium]|nr:GDSL-type esterase/lipase family protein [Terriglobales bacterium]
MSRRQEEFCWVELDTSGIQENTTMMSLHKVSQWLTLALLCGAASTMAAGQARWVGSWAASQQLVEPRNSLSPDDLRDSTLRQIVHLSLGGPKLRVHLSNRFGTVPLRFTSVHIARPLSASSSKIDTSTDRGLTFAGSPDVIVPAGADYVSDAIDFAAPALSDLAITLRLETPPAEQTGHPGSRATSYISHADLVSAADLPDAKKVEHWYSVAGVDVAAPASASAIVTLGDSITDGHGATTDANNRWPDVLARRLQAAAQTRTISVLNHGIGGNRLLLDGLGPNALARFDHDVLAQAGVRYLMVLEGINDIGTLSREHEVPPAEHDALVHRMIAAYEQIIARAHTHGIKVIGATILPFVGSGYYHPGAAAEGDRQAVNKWIRAAGHFDAVVDLDKVTRDPEHPDRLLPTFDSGDHLHPSPAGYAAMAEAIPLSLFSTAGAPQIAITFDDLPAHGPLPPGETRMEVASKILAALRDAHLPPTYGFVNGVRIQEQPADEAVLRAWRAAGNPLGNHGWSHMNLNQRPLEDVEQDVTRDEPVLKQWMKDEDWHWFRYPFLAEGDTPEKKAAFRSFLREHGYKVAAVTMSFADYLWNDPYARCKTKADDAAMASLQSSYLSAAEQSADYYRNLSQTLYGRDIPYVLLMHIGAFDAEMLPRLLSLYRSKGFEFVALEEAERDEFYREATDLHLPPGPDMLEGAIAERHLPLPSRPAAFQPDSMCR